MFSYFHEEKPKEVKSLVQGHSVFTEHLPSKGLYRKVTSSMRLVL